MLAGGIGGSAGFAVGKKLWELSRRHPVICVTHLPQIASFADHHVAVSKQQDGGRTVSTANTLAEVERVREVGRMIGYTGHVTNQNAKEMLAVAADWKREFTPIDTK